ncbi:DUF3768 domain-containing protein [Rhodopila sp.]|uniref:DUF3768 domain-containing protein n=1 Tax=Rhodopila sp. TaxID=2480087 RepID=UPI003D0FA957
MTARSERVRALNDNLRTTGQGGEIVATRGLLALGPETVAKAFAAVQRFADFTTDNDPHGEHDFAVLQPCGLRVMFKIDYYNGTLSGHSPDPADPKVTRRVLTIMLVEEY